MGNIASKLCNVRLSGFGRNAILRKANPSAWASAKMAQVSGPWNVDIMACDKLPPTQMTTWGAKEAKNWDRVCVVS